jgi:hypothetical protein
MTKDNVAPGKQKSHGYRGLAAQGRHTKIGLLGYNG